MNKKQWLKQYFFAIFLFALNFLLLLQLWQFPAIPSDIPKGMEIFTESTRILVTSVSKQAYTHKFPAFPPFPQSYALHSSLVFPPTFYWTAIERKRLMTPCQSRTNIGETNTLEFTSPFARHDFYLWVSPDVRKPGFLIRAKSYLYQ